MWCCWTSRGRNRSLELVSDRGWMTHPEVGPNHGIPDPAVATDKVVILTAYAFARKRPPGRLRIFESRRHDHTSPCANMKL